MSRWSQEARGGRVDNARALLAHHLEIAWRDETQKPAGPGGRGIGLALVRQAVGRLGGTLAINGRRGAKFEVFLPAAVSAEKEHRQ